jgi:hypothetical protein
VVQASEAEHLPNAESTAAAGRADKIDGASLHYDQPVLALEIAHGASHARRKADLALAEARPNASPAKRDSSAA